MDDLKKIAKGDTVKVYDTTGMHAGQPDGGWDGTVIHVGRKLVRIDYPGWPADRQPQSFDIERQVSCDDERRSFKTLAQAERDDRENAALAFLREHGLGPLREGTWPTMDILEGAAYGIQIVLHPLIGLDDLATSYDPMAED